MPRGIAPVDQEKSPKKTSKSSFKTTSMVKKQIKVKGFKPSKNGFKFPNRFAGFPLPPALKAFIDTSNSVHGLCGGMCFAVIDFAKTKKKMPQVDDVPTEETPLYDYIKRRQLATWGRLQLKALQYVKWMTYSEEKAAVETLKSWRSVRSMLNRSDFAVLGLLYHNFKETFAVWDNHQVLAYGYSEMNDGRFRIHLYDPNYPNRDDIYIDCEPIQVMHDDKLTKGLKCVQYKGDEKLHDMHGFLYVSYKPEIPPKTVIESAVSK